jgi:hypothetical protein
MVSFTDSVLALAHTAARNVSWSNWFMGASSAC